MWRGRSWHRYACAVVALGLLGAPVATPTAARAADDAAATAAVAADTWQQRTVDPGDRASTSLAFTRWLRPALDQAPEWSGDVETCTVGSESDRSRAATIATVNYYRAMAGLTPVVEERAWSDKALQAAVMMHSARALSHYPGDDWPCATADGIEAAGRSNLSLSWRAGGNSIVRYMWDQGDNNAPVGHRRWILTPQLRRVGTGSTTGVNALWVVDDDWTWPDLGEVTWSSWPPAGHVPWEIAMVDDEDRRLFRWSLTAHAHPGVDFADATVEARLHHDGRDEQLEATVDWRDDTTGTDSTLVWHLGRRGDVAFPVGADAHVEVTVAGVQRFGTTVPPHTWTVRLFRAEMTDVATSAHRPAIEVVTAHEIAGGYADGTFRPNADVTRSQMAAFLARALDLPPATSGGGFPDVHGAHAAAVDAVAAAGITSGYGDGTFRPEQAVTRGQMATFLLRALALEPDAPAGARFPDVRGSTHEGAVGAAFTRGVTGGFTDGNFRPDAPVTRGQMATFLSRALELEGR